MFIEEGGLVRKKKDRHALPPKKEKQQSPAQI